MGGRLNVSSSVHTKRYSLSSVSTLRASIWYCQISPLTLRNWMPCNGNNGTWNACQNNIDHRTAEAQRTLTMCTSNLTPSGAEASSKVAVCMTGMWWWSVGPGDAAKSRGIGCTNRLLVGDADREMAALAVPLGAPLLMVPLSVCERADNASSSALGAALLGPAVAAMAPIFRKLDPLMLGRGGRSLSVSIPDIVGGREDRIDSASVAPPSLLRPTLMNESFEFFLVSLPLVDGSRECWSFVDAC